MGEQQTPRGFTLVELLIVIAILGVLATYVMASISNQREKAQNAAVFAMVRDLAPLMFDCQSDGYLLQGAADVNNGGGQVCSSSSVSDRAWPSLAEKQWQWRTELDTPSGIPSGWILIAHRPEFYIMCASTSFVCSLEEGALSL